MDTVKEEEDRRNKPLEVQRYLASFHPPYCDDVKKYRKVAKVGQGTYGVVYKALAYNAYKSSHVAIKKIFNFDDNDGFQLSGLREIKILKYIRHENIIRLIEVCKRTYIASKCTNFYLIFEYCEHDLAGILANSRLIITPPEIKNLLIQLFKGIFFLHSRHIIHRDLKTSNILITKAGILKIGDFGLSRYIRPCDRRKIMEPVVNKENFPPSKQQAKGRFENCCFTNLVVTLWYRSPELLLGETNYGSEVDMWSTGCIVGEMWTRTALMPGKDEKDQLIQITNLCGSLTPEVWPRVTELELYNKMNLPKNCLNKMQRHLGPHIKDNHAVDLIEKLLTLDPSRRMIARDALKHKFFQTGVPPVSFRDTLAKYPCSMYTQDLEMLDGSSVRKIVSNRAARFENNDDTCSSYQDEIY